MEIFLAIVGIYTVVAIGRYVIHVVADRNAERVFWKCLERAKAGGFDIEFMQRINSRSVPGDMLHDVLRNWGTATIKRMFDEAAAAGNKA